MTTDNQFCYHEGVDGCNNMEEYAEKMKWKGDSNTALGLFDYEEYFPNVRTVIIDSSIDKAVNYGIEQGYDVLEAMILEKARLDKIEGLHVNLEDIDSRLHEIWSHLTDKPFNIGRANMLKKLDIQIKDIKQLNFKAMTNFIEVTNGCLTR
ncbi:MAG: hypothetical protein ACC707_13010 [Thiohalomonadales bacterium]